MKIEYMFIDKLFAFHYDNEEVNELTRLLNLWTDIEYIYGFLKDHEEDIPYHRNNAQFANELIQNANTIDDKLSDLCQSTDLDLNNFFIPLYNEELKVVELSLHKGKLKRSERYLRIYAIKIDENCYAITGGAIKLTRAMQDSEHTYKELKKLKNCRDHLRSHGVFDNDFFYEFIADE